MQQVDLRELFGLLETNFNQQVVLNLVEKIKDASGEGFDYLKFKVAVSNLQKMNMDEMTSIKSAYSTASAMGVDKSSLMTSIIKYEAALQNEKENFTQILRDQIALKIDQPKAKIDELEQLKATNERKIAELQGQIDAVEGKKAEINAEIQANEAKINKGREDFKLVVDAIESKVNADKEKINQVL